MRRYAARGNNVAEDEANDNESVNIDEEIIQEETYNDEESRQLHQSTSKHSAAATLLALNSLQIAFDTGLQEEEEHSVEYRASSVSAPRDRAVSVNEQLGIRVGVSTIEELLTVLEKINSEISTLESEHGTAIQDDYCPNQIRRLFSMFMNWYLNSGELISPSFLHSMSGMHYAPVSRSSLPTLVQLRYAIEDSLGGYYRGSAILYNGQIAWSDLANEMPFVLLYDFIRLQECHRVREQARSRFSASAKSQTSSANSSVRKFSTSDTMIRKMMSFTKRKNSDDNNNILGNDEANIKVIICIKVFNISRFFLIDRTFNLS